MRLLLFALQAMQRATPNLEVLTWGVERACEVGYPWGWANAESWFLKTGTTEEDGVEQISDSCDDEYEFIPTQTSFKIAHWTARALVTVAIGHSEELVLSH